MHGRKAFPLADQIIIGGPPLAELRLLLSNLKELIGKRTSERKVDAHTAHTRVMPALEFRHAMKMVKFAVATRAELAENIAPLPWRTPKMPCGHGAMGSPGLANLTEFLWLGCLRQRLQRAVALANAEIVHGQ